MHDRNVRAGELWRQMATLLCRMQVRAASELRRTLSGYMDALLTMEPVEGSMMEPPCMTSVMIPNMLLQKQD